MEEGELQAVLAGVLGGIAADAIAVGVAVGPVRAFAFRGSLVGEDVGPGTLFYGASLAKQFVAALLVRTLWSADASPKDPVCSWLPDLPDWIARVCLHHLLHHTSDLPDVTDPQPEAPRSNREVIDRLHRTGPTPRIYPGVRFRYNNTGYVLLAETVATMSGCAVDDLATRTIFEPLRLAATRLGGQTVRLPGQPDPPGTIGDGGLWTSVTDLLTWLTAMNDGTLEAAVVGQLETPGRLNDGSVLDYGWGLRITPTPHGRQVSHGGSWASWLAKTVRIPGRGIAVAVLSTGGTETAISDAGTQLAALIAAR